MKDRTEQLRNAKSFGEILDIEYGERGTPEREEFHKKAKLFALSEMLKDARRQAKLTQEELAEKTGTKKSYIERLESGKSDVQLSTLYRIFEKGLGKTVRLQIN